VGFARWGCKATEAAYNEEGHTVFRIVLTAAAAALLLSCNTVRSAKRPAEDVTMNVTRARAPLPDDCRVRILDVACTVTVEQHNELRTDCPQAPAPELLVGNMQVCQWGHGEMAEVNRRVCRAGGNAILREFTLTDSCIEESMDGVSGASVGIYLVYRLPP
jgi:hypothetical protein